MERMILGVLMFIGLGALLALLTQVDGCDTRNGGCSSSSSNTYDRSYRR